MAPEGTSYPPLCWGRVRKFLFPCTSLFPPFNGHAVHPLQPTAPEYSEFVMVSSKIQIRVIHIRPNDIQFATDFPCINVRNKRYSLSEEYWFTRWNKPLKSGLCNCSFRRSQRFSIISDTCPSLQLCENDLQMSDIGGKRFSNFDLPAIRITNVETYVERILQETLFEALQEYIVQETIKQMPNDGSQGVNNSAFIISKDDIDEIVLRKNACGIIRNFDRPAVLPTECVTVHSKTLSQNSVVQKKCLNIKSASCDHSLAASKGKVIVFT